MQGAVAYVQCALLHTSSNGERRIRCVCVCHQQPRAPAAARFQGPVPLRLLRVMSRPCSIL